MSEEIPDASDSRRGSKLHTTWQHLFALAESPIERDMLEFLRDAAAAKHIELLPAFFDSSQDDLAEKVSSKSLWIMAQRSVGRYRADIVIIGENPDGELITLIVECDGREFHSATIEHHHRDRARDKEMQALGLRVIRLRGHHIRKCGEICAELVLDRFSVSMPIGEDGRLVRWGIDKWERDRDEERARRERETRRFEY